MQEDLGHPSNTKPAPISDGLSWLHRCLNVVGRYGDLETMRKDLLPDFIDMGPYMQWGFGGYARDHGIHMCADSRYEYQEIVYALDKEDALNFFKENGLARGIDGRLVMQTDEGFSSYYSTHCAPKWHEMVKQGMIRMVSFGDGLEQDNIGCPLNKNYGPVYSDWDNEQFKRWLQRRFSDASGRFQIDDWKAFHIRNHIEKVRKTNANEGLVQDPLIHEFIRFQYLANIWAWADIVRASKEEARKRHLPEPAVYGNQYGASGFSPFALLLSRVSDMVWQERATYISSPFAKGGGNYIAHGALAFKTAWAAGGRKRPVWIWGPPPFPKLENTHVFEIAEALAFGAVVSQNPHGLGVPEGYQAAKKMNAFANRCPALFMRRQPYSNIGLVYSLPTHLWRRFSALTCFKQEFDAFVVTGRLLEDGHFPYDVVMFGHPEFWDDTDELGMLDKYKILILPEIDCVSERQFQALQRFVDRGGILLVSGRFAERNEEMLSLEKTDRFEWIKNHATWLDARALSACLAADRKNPPAEARKILNAQISKAWESHCLMKSEAPSTLWISPWFHSAPGLMSVHLVNWDVDIKEGSLRPAREIVLSLQLPPEMRDVEQAQVFDVNTPDPKPVSFRVANGRIHLSLSQVDQYSVIVMGKTGAWTAANAFAKAERLADRVHVATGGQAAELKDCKKSGRIIEHYLQKGRVLKARLEAEKCMALLAARLDAAILENCRNKRTKFTGDLDALVNNSVRAFDFKGPNPPGWTAVEKHSAYAREQGFGWIGGMAAIQEFQRGGKKDPAEEAGMKWLYESLGPIYGNMLFSKEPAEFAVDLPNGQYKVTLLECYHHPRACDVVANQVEMDGRVQLFGRPCPPGQPRCRSFPAKVENGQLRLRLGIDAVGACYGGRKATFSWFLSGLIIQKAGLDECKDSPLMKGSIHQWSVIGPFKDSACESLYVSSTEEEQLVKNDQWPKNQSTASLPVWRQIDDSRADGFSVVSFSKIFGSDEESFAYAKTYIESLQNQQALLHIGTTGLAKVWINGQLVLLDEMNNGLAENEYVVPIKLNKGRNRLVAKVCNNWHQAWALTAALTDPDNKELIGVGISTNQQEH